MPSATFSRETRLTGEPEAVWAAVTDVKRMVDWISILSNAEELKHLSSYKATLTDRLGPFKLRADLAIKVVDVDEGRSIRAVAEGEDRQVGSRIVVSGLATVRPVPAGVVLAVEGAYEVTGRVATLGASMINQKAGKILDEFISRAENEFQ